MDIQTLIDWIGTDRIDDETRSMIIALREDEEMTGQEADAALALVNRLRSLMGDPASPFQLVHYQAMYEEADEIAYETFGDATLQRAWDDATWQEDYCLDYASCDDEGNHGRFDVVTWYLRED